MSLGEPEGVLPTKDAVEFCQNEPHLCTDMAYHARTLHSPEAGGSREAGRWALTPTSPHAPKRADGTGRATAGGRRVGAGRSGHGASGGWGRGGAGAGGADARAGRTPVAAGADADKPCAARSGPAREEKHSVPTDGGDAGGGRRGHHLKSGPPSSAGRATGRRRRCASGGTAGRCLPAAASLLFQRHIRAGCPTGSVGRRDDDRPDAGRGAATGLRPSTRAGTPASVAGRARCQTPSPTPTT